MADQEMFRRVNAVLIEFPEMHQQAWWEEDGHEMSGSCGTTRCVAGWAVWLKATDLGLVSHERDIVDMDVMDSVAASVGVAVRNERGRWRGYDTLYEEVGAALLGLNKVEAESLFLDMATDRVTRRVASYAATGEDISDAEFDALS